MKLPYTIKIIERKGDTSNFLYRDFYDACEWARKCSSELSGSDALVYAHDSLMFMYRNGIKCDLGGKAI